MPSMLTQPCGLSSKIAGRLAPGTPTVGGWQGRTLDRLVGTRPWTAPLLSEGCTTSDYSATIDWGDGSALDAGTVTPISATGGRYGSI